MKKLISIGVALALVALVVLPIGAAAQCDYKGLEPTTYAKIPFSIVASGFLMLEDVLSALQTGGLLPDTFSWLPDLMPTLADWVGGPLGWTVDMLAWGLSLFGAVLGSAQALLTGMGIDLGGLNLADVQALLDTVACGLFQPFSCNVTGAAFTPCG